MEKLKKVGRDSKLLGCYYLGDDLRDCVSHFNKKKRRNIKRKFILSSLIVPREFFSPTFTRIR